MSVFFIFIQPLRIALLLKLRVYGIMRRKSGKEGDLGKVTVDLL
jgi:hypothetical protein